MRMRLPLCFIGIGLFLSLSAVSASRVTNRTGLRLPAKVAGVRKGGSINANSYRSPGKRHKAIVSSDDADALALAKASGAIEISDYGSFKLLAMDDSALETVGEQSRRGAGERWSRGAEEQGSSGAVEQGSRGVFASVVVRDDLNVLLLRSGEIDTTGDETIGTFVGMGRPAESYGLQSVSSPNIETSGGSLLRLVQFVGPIKRAWFQQLLASGVEPIAYVPNNGYLVRCDSTARARLLSSNNIAAAHGDGFIQWEGPFLVEHKIHPALVESMAAQSGELTVAVQLALGKNERTSSENSEVKQARKLASRVLVDAYGVLNFTNLRIKIDASRIGNLAALPSVVNIEPWTPPQLLDERSAQIVAGQLTPDRTAPRGPGYMAWLAAHGFSSAFNFAIEVSDTGVDRGVITPDKLHPDFLDSNKQSRLLYARDYTAELDPGDVEGHGTLNLSVAGGSSTASDTASRDTSGFNYGLGVAPFALLGSAKIFQSNGSFDLVDPFTRLVSDGYRDGARVSSNSWGSASNTYSIDSQEYDLRVRDAAPNQTGNQEMTICFAGGNVGANQAISEPGTAKNVISVAAGESFRKDGVDGCNVKDTDADSAMDIAFFSSGGPLDDGRMKPDITAPGTHIEGAASQHPQFDGLGVCGPAAFDQLYFPQGQTLYTWSSGTSHSTPQVAGAAALVRQFLINKGEQPNAALIKALLLNTTTYMTGDLAGGNLPQARQGWGLLNLDRAFDATAKIFVNQTNTFADSGQDFTITGEVKDSSQPFRVTLAWTDAPGFSGAAPWVNDLDLEVSINGQVYRGNNFLGQESQPGGDPDTKNNVEGVWLPAGTVGTFVVRVRASNIAGDGVPGNGDPTDQDFALVVYNGEKKDVGAASIASVTLAGGADAFADPGETVSMRLRVGDLSPIALAAGHGTLTTTATGVTVTGAGSDFPAIPPGDSAEGVSAFAFSLASSVACGTVINFVLDVTGQGSVSRVPFTVRVGRAQSTEFFSDDVESGGVKWTHDSGVKKKKLREDTWAIATKRVHSGTNSWFTTDPAKAIDTHLDTVPIQLPADGRNLQLVFFHTFDFERGTWDGGVIEISTGGDFEDLGSKILKGRYNGTILDFSSSPLAGQPGWVEGRLGSFQQVVVDLSSYAGKTVTIRFRIGTDSSGSGLGWYIDDVSLRGDRISCAPGSE